MLVFIYRSLSIIICFFFFLNNGIPKDNFRGQRSGNIPEPMKCSDTDEEDSPTMQTYEQNWCLVCFQDNPKSLEELLALMVYGCIWIVPQKNPAWIVIFKNIGQCVENRRVFLCLTYSLRHLAKCFGLKFLMCFSFKKIWLKMLVNLVALFRTEDD